MGAQKLQRISIESGENRPFKDGKGHLDVVPTSTGSVGRAVFESGWKWSDHVKPIAGTDSCQAAHMGYVISGQMTVRMDDGTTESYEPGDVMICPPGHDAWVDGNEPCVVVDWTGVADYAKPS
jgi:quercetin dioxygenase-like cupin family protein